MNQSEYILSDEAMEQNEERYHELAESLNDIVYWISADGVISYVSPAIEHLLGYRPADLIGSNYLDLIAPEDQDWVKMAFKEILQSNLSSGECRVLARNGNLRWARISGRPARLYQKVIGVQGVLTDVTERRQAEEALLAVLLEKDALVQEVHHRVKNNFQAIIDLIASRMDRASDNQTTLLLKGLQEQVRTLALVHEQLEQAGSLEQVKMRSYLQDLAVYVVEAFGSGKPVELQVETDDISLQAREAMPCGLMVNELLTNSLKHAFPASFLGSYQLRVRLKVSEELCDLVVSDNGIGLPGDVDQLASGSLGLKLVSMWAKHQLGGTLEVNNGEGTVFHITFRRRNGSHRPDAGSAVDKSNALEPSPLVTHVTSESHVVD